MCNRPDATAGQEGSVAMAHSTGGPLRRQPYVPFASALSPFPFRQGGIFSPVPRSLRWHKGFKVKPTDYGVYILALQFRSTGRTLATLYVGQGWVRDRLVKHFSNPEIRRYFDQKYIPAFWWAPTRWGETDGIERYLADTLKPEEGDRHPQAVPIPVNLP